MKNTGKSKRSNRSNSGQRLRDKWRPGKSQTKVIFKMPSFTKKKRGDN